MRVGIPGFFDRQGRLTAAALICAVCSPLGTPAHADEYRLAANTKIQVAIVQWNPSKGEYQRWEALGGTFVVSPQGTLGLPVIGSLHVSDMTGTDVAARIASALREKMRLLAAPEVTVEIAEYPPIYVVGAVTTPGAYPFRPGLTALQALAIAGGRYRPPAATLRPDTITLRGELATIRNDKLRLLGRMARLQAEIAGDTEIHFPPELTTDGNGKLAEEVVALERSLFAARANETNRQLTSLAELRDMYKNEIQMLDVQSKDSIDEIAQTQKEVASISKLVEQGITPASRWSELRRMLAQMRAAHSQDNIATMRAHQSLSDATRQEFGIHDNRQTEIATQLRDSQGDLARLNSREETLRHLLLSDSTGNLKAADGSSELRFAVVRQGQSGSAELPASESTPLMPGDVLKVETEMPKDKAPDAMGSATPADVSATDAGQ
ncbi:polysaccharide biosynthesis/export family protein [Mesorhizobium sp. BAC0120]|uniref:polysaccharide biosynthesis/export family protein n=1 Tax=Mesorhizobium sp. BAC0120 TaxID=3090670 RepID=UPI00298CF149|nr:polysaccharide biosynthesis/export family protein [Mesorhizobium sp. BAC0120]MDW6021566.1 polysaccharide biosynthesis/export family protein [Mesorhizobium sp. BAC0120]